MAASVGDGVIESPGGVLCPRFSSSFAVPTLRRTYIPWLLDLTPTAATQATALGPSIAIAVAVASIITIRTLMSSWRRYLFLWLSLSLPAAITHL